MKANEAPEKIYLTTFGFPICEPIPQEGSNPDTVWSKKPYIDADSIEYTRTDAFVEKAADYIANNMRCDGYTFRTKAKFIRDFKKYMED